MTSAQAADRSVFGDQKVLYCRPKGGLNDTLCRMEVCRSYAQKHERALVIDTLLAGLNDRFEDCFVPKPGFGPRLLPMDEQVIVEMNSMDDVYPIGAKGRVDSFLTRNIAGGRCVFEGTDSDSNFELEAGFSNRLLVYSHHGGGIQSVIFLSRVSIQPELANRIARRLLELPASFDAVHIRATDMVADKKPILRLGHHVLLLRRVLVASDNIEVRSRVSRRLSKTARVISAVELPAIGGKPIHRATERPAHFLEDALTDLLAIASAERLFVTMTDHGRVSGYASLADVLRRNPAIVLGLFDLAEARLRDALAARLKPKDGRMVRFRRLMAERLFWKWHVDVRQQLDKKAKWVEVALATARSATQRPLDESARRG